MSRQPNSQLWRCVRQAQRRLLMQRLLDAGQSAVFCSLMASLAALIALRCFRSIPDSFWWQIPLATTAIVLTTVAVAVIRRRPDSQQAAAALDHRFQLAERVTTAVTLDPSLKTIPAGMALMADAEAKVAPLPIASQFPLRLNWRSLAIPAQVALLIAVAANMPAWAPNQTMAAADPATAPAQPNPPEANNPRTAAIAKKPEPRPEKSELLKKLETDLERQLFEAERQGVSTEQAREKITALDKIQKEMQDFRREQLDKFQTLQQQMQQLDRTGKSDASKDGPAKDARDALARGDAEKAKDEIDRLRKKVKNKELTDKQKDQLAEQLAEMKSDLERLMRESEQEKKLQDAINQAKAEGRDAESLERELQELKDQREGDSQQMQEMSKALEEALEAMKKGDSDEDAAEAAEKLAKLAKQLEQMEGGLKDLEDVEEHLQRLKEARKKLCSQCEGKEGGPRGDRKDFAKGAGVGAGERPDNPNAQSNSEDQRVDGNFDPTGRKRATGSTKGNAFTKRSRHEMAGEIQEAVQEAPEAREVQRLPRAAREMVREYFEKLGNPDGSTPPK
ncbi:hypothetical protein [Tuwongella immobilis]|uniref:Chromosome partition protein Smc n=1 Tax=Tuwongella immobilis TaxID=692036 RepID=A0A6C2YLI6_9BACT|nr:hypothetical protein [Tuwongella immobilis]VIP02428.1 Putative membrane protein OS=Rhodopirellula maiorica SM1 GN=RMSM_06406 PE=4 SV=1 [Tuwongella immobilis]VTS01368.1 Putative membrane protein OS=Rhodopirellula maiorica SM1 GN=RMSM_06406 PE=4 SV=1 [Tuwongella immobilis]